MSLNKRNWISKILRKCHASLYQIWIVLWYRKTTPQIIKEQNMFTSYSRKRITKGAKFFLQIVVGLDLILSKMYYRTTTFWYAKLAPIRCKCFIEWGCAILQPANPYRKYESRHKIENLIRKWASNTMSCTPEHGGWNTRNQSLIAIKKIW